MATFWLSGSSRFDRPQRPQVAWHRCADVLCGIAFSKGETVKRIWTPSTWGRRLTFSSDWSVALEDSNVVAVIDRRTYRRPLISLQNITCEPGITWAGVRLH